MDIMDISKPLLVLFSVLILYSEANQKQYRVKIIPTNIIKTTSFCKFVCYDGSLIKYAVINFDETICQTILEVAGNPDTWLVLEGMFHSIVIQSDS